MLLASGGPAQAQDKAPQTVPEACDANPAAVISHGHFAVFDIYWDAEDKILVNNPCPPKAKHTTTARLVNGIPVKETTTTRSASNLDVRQTVFHVSEEAKTTVRATGSGDFDGSAYDFLRPKIDATRHADSAEVWILPADDSELLIIGASAGLLQAKDWKDLEWEFESIREPGIESGDRGQVFASRDTDDGPLGENEGPVWNSLEADENEMDVGPGEYKHFNWAFTKPGTYVLQVHAKAHPDLKGDNSQFKGSSQEAATSVVTRYTFHVGLMADLSVTGSATPTAPAPGSDVDFTFTIGNSGPDKATNTKVQVHLPQGLTYKSQKASTGTYNATSGVWDVGDLAKDGTANITVTATVGKNTHGKPQTATAHIFATESVGSSTVAELDPRVDDNTVHVTVTPPKSKNENPLFQVSRSVTENVLADTNVGDPIKVREPNAGDTLSFTLEGHGASDFKASSVAGGVQIKVSDTGFIDYEVKPSYDLVLGISDSKDTDGNADPSIDDRIAVKIDVTDVVGHPRLELRPDKLAPRMRERVTLRAIPHDLPAEHGILTYHWTHIYPDGTVQVLDHHHEDTLARMVQEPDPSTYAYFATLDYKNDGEQRRIKSNVVRVTWSGSRSN